MSVVVLLVCVVAAPWPGANAYLAGHGAESAGRYAEAISAYSACANAGSPLAPYARIRAAYCRGLAGDAAGAARAYQAALRHDPAGPWVRMAEVERAALLAKQGRNAEASRLYTMAITTSPSRWWMARYSWQAAENELAVPAMTEQGYRFFRGILATTWRYDLRLRAAEKLEASPSVEDRLQVAAALVRCGAYKEAALRLALVSLNVLDGSEQTARWEYLMGRILLHTNDVQGGRKLLQQALDTAPATQWGRLASAHLACSYAASGEPQAARAAFARLVKDYPDTVETGDALWWYAEHLAESPSPEGAINQYLLLVKTCPTHERADDALLAAGCLARRLGHRNEALRILTDFPKRYPDSPRLTEAYFWLGRLRETAGERKQARADYLRAAKGHLGDYYAHRAFERAAALGVKEATACSNLKVAGKRSFLRPLPEPPDPREPSQNVWARDPRCARLQFFAEHGLEEAEWEALGMAHASLPKGVSTAAWYQFLADSGLAFTATELADAAHWGWDRGRMTPARERLRYPRAYWPLMTAVAKETSVDPYLLAAVARQESTFRPALTSLAGARGLMQLMPKTAEGLTKAIPDLPEDPMDQLDDPGVSLRLGAAYLERMIERSGGNLVYALASYNAGPGNVAKWRKARPNADLETFVETIPFLETRDYVKRVLGNYAAYHSLYAEGN